MRACVHVWWPIPEQSYPPSIHKLVDLSDQPVYCCYILSTGSHRPTDVQSSPSPTLPHSSYADRGFPLERRCQRGDWCRWVFWCSWRQARKSSLSSLCSEYCPPMSQNLGYVTVVIQTASHWHGMAKVMFREKFLSFDRTPTTQTLLWCASTNFMQYLYISQFSYLSQAYMYERGYYNMELDSDLSWNLSIKTMNSPPNSTKVLLLGDHSFHQTASAPSSPGARWRPHRYDYQATPPPPVGASSSLPLYLPEGQALLRCSPTGGGASFDQSEQCRKRWGILENYLRKKKSKFLTFWISNKTISHWPLMILPITMLLSSSMLMVVGSVMSKTTGSNDSSISDRLWLVM